MRANPSKILTLAAVCLLVPAAFARPAHKSAARPVHVVAAKSTHKKEVPTAKTVKVHGKSRPAPEPAPKMIRVHGKLRPAPEPAPKMVRVHGKLRPAPVEMAAPKMIRVHGHWRPAPVAVVPVHVAKLAKPAPVARPEPVVEEAPALAPIHVQHDRKVHLATPPPASVETSEAPKKATPEDLIAAAAVAAPVVVASNAETTGVSHPDEMDERGLLDTKPAVKIGPVSAPKKIVEPKMPAPVTAAVVKSALTTPAAVKAPVVAALKEPEPEPVAIPALYTKNGRLIMPPAMKGSHEILVRQNQVADSDGLERIQDDADLEAMRSNKLLVALPTGAGIQTDERLPLNRRYCRPWTAAFLTALARAHYAQFHTALQVNSAVRTVEFQQRLLRTNGNAAPAGGETASPHLTGQAVDLAKHGLSLSEIAWLRGYLLPLVQQGKVDVEEEFQQSCFHISVYKKYLPQATPRREIAPKQHSVATALAVAIP